MASSAYPSLFSEKITKEIGGASSLIGNREARTKSIFKKYGDKSAYFFGPSLIFSAGACWFPPGAQARNKKKYIFFIRALFFFYSTNSPASARFFSEKKKIQKSSFSWLFLFISKRTPIYEYAIRALAL